jgi:hypothetical protein
MLETEAISVFSGINISRLGLAYQNILTRHPNLQRLQEGTPFESAFCKYVDYV